jgi:Tol biopolymer transport system component
MSTSRPATPLHRFAHYEVTAKIGEGGMGEVYRATDSKLDREVALKVIPAEFAEDPDRMARFEDEAKALAALNHPNIATVFDLEQVEGRFILVMELLEGEPLRERLAEGSLPYRKAAEIGGAVARGLGAAHERGIVHRDVKPENIFLTRDGQVKILDFGLATDLDLGDRGDETNTPTVTRRTHPGTIVGTVGYMSPEQVRGDRVDARSDIFALGAVLYEMVTGRRAFRRDTTAETMTAILREEPAEFDETAAAVPATLVRTIRRCLEKRPEERFQSATDLAFDLENITAGSHVSFSDAAPVAGTRWTRRAPAWLIVVVAVGAALVATVGTLMLAPSSGSQGAGRIGRLTHRRGMVWSARFAPDGQSVVYGATWEGAPLELYTTRLDGVDSRPYDLGSADVLAISDRGEMALSMDRRFTVGWETTGTLATTSIVGSAPRPLLEDVEDADWGPDGASLAVVREVEGRYRLEYPLGRVLYQADGWLSNVRVHPSGELIAFSENPIRGDNGGVVAVVDLDGNRRVLLNFSSQGLAWTPDGNELWSSSGRRLVAVTPSGELRLVYSATAPVWLQDISANGQVLIASTDIRREMVGRGPDDGPERNLSWFDWSAPQALSDDGRTVLFDEQNMSADGGYFVYVRGTDGSPPVRIGNGTGRALSPDGRWALTVSRPFGDSRWVLLPTGAGESRELPEGEVQSKLWAQWLPDGERLVVAGSEVGGTLALYERGIDSADETILTPGGIDYIRSGYAVSPDGAWVTATPIGGSPMMFPIGGGDPRPIPGLEELEIPIQWTSDGSALYVYRSGGLPARVWRLDPKNGSRSPWLDLGPSDPAGVFGIDTLFMTPDGVSYIYSYRRLLSTLYVMEGLR